MAPFKLPPGHILPLSPPVCETMKTSFIDLAYKTRFVPSLVISPMSLFTWLEMSNVDMTAPLDLLILYSLREVSQQPELSLATTHRASLKNSIPSVSELGAGAHPSEEKLVIRLPSDGSTFSM